MVFLIILSVFFSLDSRVNRFIMALAFLAAFSRSINKELDGRLSSRALSQCSYGMLAPQAMLADH